MHQAFVNICRVPTRILTQGAWIEESLADKSEIIICITGNPGLVGFYKQFSEDLYQRLEQKMPVWIIGHMGHEEPPPTSLREVPQLKGNEELFDLKSQVQHKIEFIERYVPSHVKVHLVGHSIGAWMTLQLLSESHIRARLAHCYLLFPTVERMIESPNGWIFTKILLPIYSVFGFLITLFNYLPAHWRLFFIRIFLWLSAIPGVFAETVLDYARTSVVEKVVFLAEDEMARVRGLQHDLIKEHSSLLTLFYGSTDGWVPVEYYRQLLELYPKLDVVLDKQGLEHSFVLQHATQVAEVVGNMIVKHSALCGESSCEQKMHNGSLE